MDVTERKRLTREDWVQAGLEALRSHGPGAVAIEPLAARLATTKGSGYWHFTNRAALLTEVMRAWEDLATAQVIERVESVVGSPRERLHRLLIESTPHADSAPAVLLVVGSSEPVVRAAVQRVTAQRIDYVAMLIEQAGIAPEQARVRAVLTYSAYLGGISLIVAAPATVKAVSPKMMRETTLNAALKTV